jgi:hypothetical protein
MPHTRHTEWTLDAVKSVDNKPGNWEVAVHPDPDKMYIIQLRNDVSLTAHLKRLQPIDDPQEWPKIISRAPEPPSTLVVNPDPSPAEFKRVLAKAIINEQLTTDDNGHFMLNCLNGEKLDLGNTFKMVEKNLQPRWPYLVFIESSFARNLVVAEKDIISKLNHIKTQLESSETLSDRRLKLIDLTAVQEAIIQAELFIPGTRRIRKANRRRL